MVSTTIDLILISDGGGNVSFYVDKVLNGSSNGGPVGLQSTPLWQAGAANNADAVNKSATCLSFSILRETVNLRPGSESSRISLSFSNVSAIEGI